MLLGLSGDTTDHDIQPTALRSGAGVPDGELLVRFVDATFAGGDELAAARDELVSTIGFPAAIDAAAVVANFHMMTRIADSTGTPLDSFSEQVTGDLREGLGLNDLDTMRLDTSVG